MNEPVDSHNSNEWLNFGVLVVVFAIVILVVALTRPLIFGRIVPAIMDDGQVSAPLPAPATEPGQESPGEEENTESVTPEETEEAPPQEATATTAPETPVEEDSPVAVPTVQHTVRQGETLNKIARMYNVSVADIVTANNLANPDRIDIGTILLIPQP